MTMKGLSSSRSHHHTLTQCDPSYESLTLHHDRRPYVLNQGHPTDHSFYGCQSDLASSTFPRRHHGLHHELKDECAIVPYVGPGGIAGGTAGGCGPCSSSAIPSSLLEKFDHQPPVRKDGYHTLQYKRTAALEHQRSDSPGRIRNLVHSVQKLFTKSHSLEGPSQHSLNGNDPTNPADAMATAASHPNVSTTTVSTLHKQSSNKRGKNKERSRSEPKPHAWTPRSGYWSSDDTLDREICLYHQHQPSGVMTMGRHPDKSQSHYFLGQSYNTLGGGHSSLKTSRSNNDVGGCSNSTGGTLTFGGPKSVDQVGPLIKKSSWSSTLTVSRAREVYQKATVNIDKAVVKAPTCQQGRTCQFLQVPQDEWGGFSSVGQDDEIPCRRMRSGSYIKAMAEEDSGDSDCSPKPSPKVQARRASYLKATQPSLTEMTTLKISTESHSPKLQIRSHSYLRAVSEVEVNGQIEAVCESVFSETSQAVDALDLPGSGCFRMRSHSYVRAIEKGCSQEEEEERAIRQAISPPRSTTTVRTIQNSTVSSCITTYKKTPPPVPPRSTPTRPYISITAQSSTESAQDAYNELTGAGPANRALATVQSGLSNSTESIDSMKALTAAIEAANAQVHGPASQHVTNNTITITTATATTSVTHISQEAKRDALRKCLSIGIQVDGPEEANQSEVHCKFQSVGVQVEEERCHHRVTRSNSVTTAVQADLDLLECLGDDQFTQTHQGPIVHQPSRDAATSTVSIQGSGNHYHACVQDDYTDVGFDPSILPPPDPWMDGAMEEEYASRVSGFVCPQDGRWFLKLLQAEVERMEGWCKQMERDEREHELPEDILGKIRSAVGSAQLLMSQKFQQFRELCEENLNPNAHPRPVSQDLAGFWDMLQLSIENISLKFDELHQLKANNWKALLPPERKERRVPPPVPRKPGKGPVLLVRDRSLEGSQRLEARKRLLAAKRAAASQRQSSVTECADSIEIYIPEAQTRL
ncbi:disks large-associated protein 1-like isoform X3 [Carassius carassius]|uniref:disks large-associated protein 1-like isoform X3 n=1 Tax=Carassius carassius TaxID=217509 RepID=UPI002868F56D|nr:disks large-associated protein 1-like isoform X3 [Carassius carassius]